MKENLEKEGIEVSIANTWAEGGKGTIDLAEKVVKAADSNVSNITFTYDLNETIENKIRAVARRVYGAEDIILEDKAIAQIENITNLG